MQADLPGRSLELRVVRRAQVDGPLRRGMALPKTCIATTLLTLGQGGHRGKAGRCPRAAAARPMLPRWQVVCTVRLGQVGRIADGYREYEEVTSLDGVGHAGLQPIERGKGSGVGRFIPQQNATGHLA